MLPFRQVALVLASISLVPHSLAQAPCPVIDLYSEDFDSGVLPEGWTAGPFWSVTSSIPCAITCQTGFFAFYGSTLSGTSCSCEGTCGHPGCADGSFLISPAIALPWLDPGEQLSLEFCIDSILFTNTGGCNRLRIEHAAGNTDFQLGNHFFGQCRPWSFPPFDLTPYAGQVIRLHWLPGSADCEAPIFMKLDDVRVTLSGNSGGGLIYCPTSPNSAGAGALMWFSGHASKSLNDTALLVFAAAPNQPGIFYYGDRQTQLPFGDGWRCVGGKVERLLPTVIVDSFGNGNFPLDLLGPPPAGTIQAGETWNFQFWYRDPPGGPAGFNLSDALELTFCP